jgi:hypothetical protein
MPKKNRKKNCERRKPETDLYAHERDKRNRQILFYAAKTKRSFFVKVIQTIFGKIEIGIKGQPNHWLWPKRQSELTAKVYILRNFKKLL